MLKMHHTCQGPIQVSDRDIHPPRQGPSSGAVQLEGGETEHQGLRVWLL